VQSLSSAIAPIAASTGASSAPTPAVRETPPPFALMLNDDAADVAFVNQLLQLLNDVLARF
jgi:hypothetical protein